MISIPLFNQEGKEVGKAELPEDIFGLKLNHDLVKQAVEAQLSQSRISYAHTKTRGEVRGGGKKPWRQKGTGRARHGSSRSPIWIGGGVTFGPRKEKNFVKKINKKMKRQALFMVLSGKIKDKEIILLDDLKLAETKTKHLDKILNSILEGTVLKKEKDIKPKYPKNILIILPGKDERIILVARNIPGISVLRADSLNVKDLLSYKYLLMPQSVISIIEKTYLKK